MTTTVLVTGAFGLVGTATVSYLQIWGHRVVATDLDVPAHRKAAARLPEQVRVRWCDLTDPEAAQALLAEVRPDAVIHLAAIIPPACYAHPALAQRVNVEATAYLVNAAETLTVRPRFVQASSVAVHGHRNPYAHADILNADTPLNPTDPYGSHKASAEDIVRSSKLEWVVLRLGAVISTTTFPFSNDHVIFESMLPSDNRVQTVDVRDVAVAFVAAVDAEVTGEILMIGGDDRTHRMRHGDLGPAIAGALGLVGGMPKGRKGDPRNDRTWFTTDWMDTRRAQEALGFQHHSWPGMLKEIRESAGLKYHLLRAAAPFVRWYLGRRSPYRKSMGPHADVETAVRKRWGHTELVVDESHSRDGV